MRRKTKDSKEYFGVVVSVVSGKAMNMKKKFIQIMTARIYVYEIIWLWQD